MQLFPIFYRTKGSLELLGLGGPECQGDITPKVCPSSRPTASATALQPPVYCVCELFTCFVCCHPASETRQTANSPRRTKCGAVLNSLPFPAPCSRHSHLPHSPFPRGGSRNRPKIGQLFIGSGELWGYHKPPGVLVVERQSSPPLASSFFSFPLATARLRGPHSLRKPNPPHPTPFCRSFP